MSADAKVPHGKLFPFINNECVAGPMKQSRFNKPRGALSRRNVLNAFLQALQPDRLSNVILSKVRRNKSIPRFSLSGCVRQVAYTSYRFLSVNRFQGEHIGGRSPHATNATQRTPQCKRSAQSAAHRCRHPCIYQSMPERPS